MSIPNAAVTFPDATRTENTRCGSMDLSATGQTQPSALRLNALLAQRSNQGPGTVGFWFRRVAVPGQMSAC